MNTDVLTCNKGALSFPNYVAQLIRNWGLHNDPIIDFGKKNEKYRSTRGELGMLQTPEQLAPALIYLNKFKIKSYIEVGSHFGSTFAFICLYLSRFGLTDAISVDIDKSLFPQFRDILKGVVNVKEVIGTSRDVKGVESSLCFIDADHKYESVRDDYMNVGRYARICMFHDIIDEYVVRDRDDAGSKQFWNEIKQQKFYKEFTKHPDNKEIMGIGVIQ